MGTTCAALLYSDCLALDKVEEPKAPVEKLSVALQEKQPPYTDGDSLFLEAGEKTDMFCTWVTFSKENWCLHTVKSLVRKKSLLSAGF